MNHKVSSSALSRMHLGKHSTIKRGERDTAPAVLTHCTIKTVIRVLLAENNDCSSCAWAKAKAAEHLLLPSVFCSPFWRNCQKGEKKRNGRKIRSLKHSSYQSAQPIFTLITITYALKKE